jgi:hypothetical protein
VAREGCAIRIALCMAAPRGIVIPIASSGLTHRPLALDALGGAWAEALGEASAAEEAEAADGGSVLQGVFR